MKNRYPIINYIGNKEKVASWIINKFPIKSGTILDLFSGGCSIAYELKRRGFNVICNDALFSSFVLAQSIIVNSKITLSKNDINVKVTKKMIDQQYKKICFLTNRIYFDYEVKELAKLILIANKLKGFKKYMFLSLLRRAMIRKIPYSRMNIKWSEIKKFRDEAYSYKKYKRYRHYHNIPFMDHIILNMKDFNNSLINNETKNSAFNLDAIECLNSIKKKVDLIYLDPPYPSTMNNYYNFYGFYDLMFGVKSKFKTSLTKKATFIENLKKIVKKASTKTKYLSISLSNHSVPSIYEIIKIIEPLSIEYKVYKKPHVYQVTGSKNKKQNFEMLLIAQFKD